MRRVFLVAGSIFLGACGGGAQITVIRPVERAFVPSGVPIPMEMRADGASRLVVRVDGEPALEVIATAGVFQGSLGPLGRGRHVLTVEAPEVAGMAATQEIFVDRLPDPHVDGFGGAGADWVLTLSDAAMGDDGLLRGALTLASVSTSDVGLVSRRLSTAAFFAEVATGVEARVAWIEGGSGGRGTLHVDSAAGDPARATTFDRVRAMKFAPDGWSLAALDDGLFLLETPFLNAQRITESADGAAFIGPAEDLLAWRFADDGAHAELAAAPEYLPVAISSVVAGGYAANPARREVALQRAEGGAPGALILYQVDTEASALLYGAVSRFGFSADGQWLLAITGADPSGAGNIALLRRAPPSGSATLPGSFIEATFDPAAQSVLALERDGSFAEIDLATFAVSPIASGVTSFAVLPTGALVWEDLTGAIWVRRSDAVVESVGALNGEFLEVALSPDGTTLAFTAIAAGGRRPVRRVDLATGVADDFGWDAHRPAFLADGALAWAEVRADAEVGGSANDDLWMFPAFPQSIQGPRQIAARVMSEFPFSVSPDGSRIAVLSDLPRLGERGAPEARCFDTHLHGEDLGPADPERREIRFRADSRLLWVGADRVLFLARCR